MITIFTIALFILGAGAWMLWDRRRQRQWFLAKLRRMWGSVTDREYSTEELESISHYARRHRKDRFLIDDITWNDLSMDQMFVNMNTTVSSCGEDVLYAMLRLPEFDEEVLKERNRLIEYFRTHQKERENVQMLVREVRKISSMSLSDYIFVLKDVEQKRVAKYVLLACLTLAGIGAIFVQPLTGALLLLVILCFNGYVHMKDSKKIEPYLNCFLCILRLLKAADGFSKMKNPEIQEHLDRIEGVRKKLQGFRRGAFLVTSANAMQDGLEAFVLSYLKIMFQVDIIKFYSMVKGVRGHEAEIDELFTAMGELDALIAVASFREYLPYYSIPELRKWEDRKEMEQISVEMTDLYHPLIPNPVANSIRIDGGILVTGSNASGKSTFLKTVALNAILSQTIYTCISHSYRGDYVKVMTSMALRDNLEGGESYYIVEIKSLQRILEECEKKQPVLCIVDEVLRGTNTIERIAASSRILKYLSQPYVLPLAATHDIELSYILEKQYENYHFEEEIKDHDVLFNYQLKEGRATTRNAIKLLEMIGYDQKIVSEAQEAARKFEQTGIWE
ncbi:MAG: DNA mismatch repair protein MutS [Oliverpabstia sp.]|nr:DNA mismatch repair protein MutS [Oliverpabstia sp.]